MPSIRKPSHAAEVARLHKQKSPVVWVLVVVLVLIVITVGGVYIFLQGQKQEPVEAEVPVEEPIRSIAVLPFRDMSPGKDQEYLGDGIAETIINTLTQIEDINVPASTSSSTFKDKDLTIIEIGKQLNVETVLEGTVQKEGNFLRVTAQLIKVADGFHLWSKKYDREFDSIFTIQDSISSAIVEALKGKVLGLEKSAIERRYTENPEAYELYLLGHHYWNLRYTPQQRFEMLRKGLENFQKAVEKDPDFALAYTKIADSYHQLGFGNRIPREEAYRKGQEAVEKALELDDTLAEVHVSLGWRSEFKDIDIPSAGRKYKKAVELNPNSVLAHWYYGGYLSKMRRYNEALDEVKRVRTLDPLVPRYYEYIIWLYWHMDRYDEAMKECYKGIEIFPEWPGFYTNLTRLYYQQSKYTEALQTIQLARKNLGDSTWGEAELGYIYALSGERARAEQIIAKLTKKEDLANIARIYGALGEKEKAKDILSSKGINNGFIYTELGEFDKVIDIAEKIYEENPGSLVQSIKFLELYNKDIRSHPRYIALMKKLGMEE